MRDPVRVIHSQCGGIVFFHDGLPEGKYGILDPKKCILHNGANARDGDPIICPLCQYKVQPNQLQWVINDE